MHSGAGGGRCLPVSQSPLAAWCACSHLAASSRLFATRRPGSSEARQEPQQHRPALCCSRLPAQVSSGMKSVTLMAKRINAAHRWAVTGTPLGPACLGDLHGLLQVFSSCIIQLSFSTCRGSRTVVQTAASAPSSSLVQKLCVRLWATATCESCKLGAPHNVGES